MTNCTSFPVRQSTNVVFYITNVILVPVLFGIGLMGNVLTSLLCNHASIRKENAVFIHLCGLTIVDAISLLCTVPRTLQEAEIFPANVTYSRFMAYADMGSYVFGNIAHHAALWLLVTAGFLKLHIAKNPYESSRVSRNGTNRIIVFVCVLVCVLFNFPRFLQVSVREVAGHCFTKMSLWTFKVTSFGNLNLVKAVYPWAIIGVCYALPLLLILIAMLSLGRHAGWRKLRTERLALLTSYDDDKRRLGLLKAIWVLLLAGFCMEVPNLIVEVFKIAFPEDFNLRGNIMNSSGIIANYLGLVRASLTFVVLVVYCSDFRKAMRRSLCCLCSCSDEFYEPCACCSLSYRRELKASKQAEKEKLKQKAKKKAKAKKAREAKAASNGQNHARSSNVYGAAPSQAMLYGPDRILYPTYEGYANAGTLLTVPTYPAHPESTGSHSSDRIDGSHSGRESGPLGRDGSMMSRSTVQESLPTRDASPMAENGVHDNRNVEDVQENNQPPTMNERDLESHMPSEYSTHDKQHRVDHVYQDVPDLTTSPWV